MGMTRNVLHCRLTSWVATENEGISRQSDIDRIRFISDYFNDTDGQIISQRERSRLLLEDQHFTYGEIDPNSFIQILRDGEAFDGQIFYDLGSGSGKSLVTAALSGFSFLKVVGIEYLSGLCDASKILLENLKKLYEKKITFNGKSLSDYSLNSVNLPILRVIEGDILVEDWSEADIIYVNIFSSLFLSCPLIIDYY
jgi:hypothetical protein